MFERKEVTVLKLIGTFLLSGAVALGGLALFRTEKKPPLRLADVTIHEVKTPTASSFLIKGRKGPPSWRLTLQNRGDKKIVFEDSGNHREAVLFQDPWGKWNLFAASSNAAADGSSFITSSFTRISEPTFPNGNLAVLRLAEYLSSLKK